MAAREAGVIVQAKVRVFNTPLTSEEKLRFKSNGVTSNTWGAIKLRISKQETQKGTPEGWSIKFPYGSLKAYSRESRNDESYIDFGNMLKKE